ncbi:MAG: D-alanyl-D-alanine carboxypeptidase [Ancalomicrobiaceae bacterium]|nr:D-alanyl-D-alanine carboxypeptidase [Ancalomicrobiaceae bacterium]
MSRRSVLDALPDAVSLDRRSMVVGLGGLVAGMALGTSPAAAKPEPPRRSEKGKPEAKDKNPQGFDTTAVTALLTDFDSGTVLYEKNPDQLFYPASLTKMMTVAVVAEMLKDGKLSLDQEYQISEHAWRTGGAPSHTSTMFAEINSHLKVVDLLQGVMVVSANDGAIALAEGIAGSEQAFAQMMNKRAAELGMTASHFNNPTGLPDPDNHTTARDLDRLARHLIVDHPDIYKFFSLREYTNTVSSRPIRQLNRDPLIAANIGADGIKTGYIKESGYNICGSAVQNGQRLILVMSGFKTEKERAEEAKKLMEWGFKTFEQIPLYKEGESPGDASVFGGSSGSVPLVTQKPIDVLVARGHRENLRARVVYTGPLQAPVEKGRQVGKLQVLRGDSVIQETPLYTGADVPVGKLHQRALDAVSELVTGWIRGSVGLR